MVNPMMPRQLLIALTIIIPAVFSFDSANGQCILANPSFEIGGSGGPVFGGWNQFGAVGSVTTASHGHQAARVSGPGNGTWDMSGFWQRQDCSPGEQWEATGQVQHPSTKPLTGSNAALVNIEWRNAAGDLIEYESFTVADAATVSDVYQEFSLTSSPAPAGTTGVRFLVGTLQGPSDPTSDVYFDQVTFFSTSFPTIDEQQWHDYPGEEILSFGGYNWRVKGPGVYGPGNNYFCDSSTCAWVDAEDQLHLTLKNQGSYWSSTEVTCEDPLGYGDYILTTIGRLDQIDPQAVLGIFLWEYGTCWDYGYLWWNAFNEIDIEYSRWGNAGSDIAQFVAQPYDYPNNISRFDANFGDEEVVSHAMRWLPDRVEYRVWRGGPTDESDQNMVHSWTYTGPHIPRPEQPRMHLNLWKLEATPATNQEVVFTDFNFIPEGGMSAADLADNFHPAPNSHLFAATPNPFNPQTQLRFELIEASTIQLDIYDLSGRLVRSLVDDYLDSGEHHAIWDGRDQGGKRVGSGVYLVRLRGDNFIETTPTTLVK